VKNPNNDFMNFQGPRDLTPDDKQYQQVMVFLLYIQNSYSAIYETLLEAPQFEYELEKCRQNKSWARKYLLMLKNLVQQYERESLPAFDELELHKSQVPALSVLYFSNK
jgi:hypothetical protein